MNKKFIMTDSEDTAKALADFGAQMISKTDTCWIFLNDAKLHFDHLKKITYTDKLFFDYKIAEERRKS